MKILFIGDIVGKTGRETVFEILPMIKETYMIDVVIANAENSAHGKGITEKIYNELIFNGISIITMGNHTYAKNAIFDFIDEADRLVVPYNKLKRLPGCGSRVFESKNKKIRVTNLLGTSFMSGFNSSPFEAIDSILESCTEDIHIIDFHAETTSEKIALGYYLDGKVTAVLGTHTHVQTADEKILPNGTAFICDVGMCGPYESVIGNAVEAIITRLTTGIYGKFEVAEGEGQFCGVVITVDEQTCKATSIERILLNQDHPLHNK